MKIAPEEPRFELTAIPSGTIALTAPSHHYTTLYLNPEDVPALIAALQQVAGIPGSPPPHEAVARNAGMFLTDRDEAAIAFRTEAGITGLISPGRTFSEGFDAGWLALHKRLDAAHAAMTTPKKETQA